MAAQLKLIVDNPEPRPVAERSTFADAWALREGQMKKRGDGIEKTRLAWDKAAKKVGQARLLEALKKFLRETKEPTCGHPGLSVWLNGQRYDHWLADLADSQKDEEARQSFPEPMRAVLADQLSDSFVRSYLDPCEVHADGWITPATEFARKKLLEKAKTLKVCGLVGIRNKNA